jgi:hypothetical protein
MISETHLRKIGYRLRLLAHVYRRAWDEIPIDVRDVSDGRLILFNIKKLSSFQWLRGKGDDNDGDAGVVRSKIPPFK